MFSSLVSCLIRLYGHSEYQPMRASFSSWCDEYYNLKMPLIGELFRSKAILERRQASVKISYWLHGFRRFFKDFPHYNL